MGTISCAQCSECHGLRLSTISNMHHPRVHRCQHNELNVHICKPHSTEWKKCRIGKVWLGKGGGSANVVHECVGRDMGYWGKWERLWWGTEAQTNTFIYLEEDPQPWLYIIIAWDFKIPNYIKIAWYRNQTPVFLKAPNVVPVSSHSC